MKLLGEFLRKCKLIDNLFSSGTPPSPSLAGMTDFNKFVLAITKPSGVSGGVGCWQSLCKICNYIFTSKF